MWAASPSATRPAASGLYLSSYYCGGLAGAAVIGQLFDRFRLDGGGRAACSPRWRSRRSSGLGLRQKEFR